MKLTEKETKKLEKIQKNKKIPRRLKKYNAAQQKNFLMYRKSMISTRKLLKYIEKDLKGFDFYALVTHASMLKDHLNTTDKKIQKKTKKILDKMNKEYQESKN